MLKLYNTLTKKEEEFVPIDPKHIRMYTCGPTVYSIPHIGNYRAYIFADILRRYFTYLGYPVTYVMNLTDVDDKTIRDSQKENKNLCEFTDFYIDEFYKDLKSLNVKRADVFPRATEHIQEMADMIEALVDKGFAYKTDDGSVYFDIKKFKKYGNLSGVDTGNLKEGGSGRIKADEYDKENVQDFALWKAWDEEDGDVFWETPLGKGRPGWHIECSAMSMKYLTDAFENSSFHGERSRTIDIHTGGVDLIFPHHENEIAQSECCTDSKFVNYWLHNEHLLVDGKKMSKSLGNQYNLRDITEKGFSPLDYRYLLLTTHYRNKVNFTWESLEAARNTLDRLVDFAREHICDEGAVNKIFKEKFMGALNDDLNTPQALAVMWDMIKDKNMPSEDKYRTLLDFDTVLGLGLDNILQYEIPENILELAHEREGARIEKDFKKADELRKKLNDLGYEVKDTDTGPSIRPLS